MADEYWWSWIGNISCMGLVMGDTASSRMVLGSSPVQIFSPPLEPSTGALDCKEGLTRSGSLVTMMEPSGATMMDSS